MFTPIELDNLSHTYHKGKIGLTGQTYSSIMSWDDFLSQRLSEQGREQSWSEGRETAPPEPLNVPKKRARHNEYLCGCGGGCVD